MRGKISSHPTTHTSVALATILVFAAVAPTLAQDQAERISLFFADGKPASRAEILVYPCAFMSNWTLSPIYAGTHPFGFPVPSDKPLASAIADESGEVAVALDPARSYLVVARRDNLIGFHRLERSLWPPPGVALPVQVVLLPWREFVVVVTNPDGRPVPGIMVGVANPWGVARSLFPFPFSRSPDELVHWPTDAQGRARFAAPEGHPLYGAPEVLALAVIHGGEVVARVFEEKTSTAELGLSIPHTRTVRLQVVDDAGQPARATAYVSWRRPPDAPKPPRFSDAKPPLPGGDRNWQNANLEFLSSCWSTEVPPEGAVVAGFVPGATLEFLVQAQKHTDRKTTAKVAALGKEMELAIPHGNEVATLVVEIVDQAGKPVPPQERFHAEAASEDRVRPYLRYALPSEAGLEIVIDADSAGSVQLFENPVVRSGERTPIAHSDYEGIPPGERRVVLRHVCAPHPRILSGRVVDPRGTLIPNAAVFVEMPPSKRDSAAVIGQGWAFSNEKGEFALHGLSGSPDRVVVAVKADGFRAFNLSHPLGAAGVTLEASPTATLRGGLRAPHPSWFKDILSTARAGNGDSALVTWGEAGGFLAENLLAGSYTFAIQRAGDYPARSFELGEFSVKPGENLSPTAFASIDLAKLFDEVRVIVQDAEGRPAVGAIVDVEESGPRRSYPSRFQLDRRGAFSRIKHRDSSLRCRVELQGKSSSHSIANGVTDALITLR